uniref:Retrovirus-related Pol polyprotein from transposon TNT 1-94 n=1 Tax=Tanacetum cinerariifolium TaxID=118510 RepID=A0A6L2KBI2_TANCI|nr:retrovirus-related Pol polyprotein from transposon TNT 1-94 [Tanacetum cinerariifolium]
MGWYCNWRWHINHGDERRAFYIKLNPDVLISGQNCISKGFVNMHKLRGYASALQHRGTWLDLGSGVASGFGVILARTPVWRMESYALKFADDVLLGIFGWGKPVWTGVDDVLLPAPVLEPVLGFRIVGQPSSAYVTYAYRTMKSFRKRLQGTTEFDDLKGIRMATMKEVSPTAYEVDAMKSHDDPIASLNKAMVFISTAFASRYPPTNNQLRTSSNLRNQETIHDGSANVTRCYNYQKEGHMAIQCTKPKRSRNFAWFKEKAMLAEALESKVALNEEQMTFLVDNKDTVTTGQASQELVTTTAFQTNDLDAIDSNCDEAPLANAKCLIQVAKCNEVDKMNKTVNESLIAELERYKEQIKLFEERQKCDLNDREKYIDSQMLEVIIDRNAKQHDSLSVVDTEETLEMPEESSLKMHAKQNDPISKEKKVNISPIDYAIVNRMSQHFVKHFVPQKNLSVKQAFWLPISKPVSEIPMVQPEPVLKEIPRELPTISLVKDSFNKTRSHVNDFENVVTLCTKVTGIHNDVTNMKEVFTQMETHVAKCCVERKTFEIKEKELLLENDRLLELIISQDLMHTVVNTLATILDYQDMEKSYLDKYNKNLKLRAELSKKNEIVEKENADILREIVEQATESRPLDNDLDSASIRDYEDYQIGNFMMSRVYNVEGFRHNLFSMGQFCDSNLEVAFHKHTYYVRDLEGVDLLKGYRGSNFYTMSLEEIMQSSPTCLLSKASKTKSWLWHRRLSHLNFGSINDLAKQGLVRKLPKLKYQKDHLCSACSLGKSKKHTHKPKSDNSIQEKLYLLHMDLYAPMRIESMSGPELQLFILGTLISGLVQNSPTTTPYVPPTKNNWDLLFQPMFDEYFNPPPSVVSSVLAVAAPRPVDPTGSPSSTFIDQAAPSASTLSTI